MMKPSTGNSIRPRRMRRVEASHYLKDVHGIDRSPATLAKYATIGGGPKYVKAGRTPLYQTDWLDEYAVAITSRPVRSSSELRMDATPPPVGPRATLCRVD